MSQKRATLHLSALLAVLVMWLPLVHGIVPHSHGEQVPHEHSHTHAHSLQDSPVHTEGESTVWSSLHGALSHEDKKILLAVLALITFWVYLFSYTLPVILIVYRCNVRKRLLQSRGFHASDINRGTWLLRGICAYRRFV
jgi:hypothetical protein